MGALPAFRTVFQEFLAQNRFLIIALNCKTQMSVSDLFEPDF
jgi:hypothetical protein